ncbi:MAG: nucleic acid-binding protein, partial [Treponema sp.]|nr:nucleic acid-binding protein [Treponema sp.]
MDATTTHREYEILDKLINEAKAKESSIRHELQREEKVLEEMQESLENEEKNIKLTEDEFNEMSEKLNSSLESYNAELEDLKEKEKEISDEIANPEVISKFQRIIMRNSKGIVAVRGSVCTGCNMILPAQFANDVHHTFKENDGKIYFCPYCSRVLYYEEIDEDEEENFIPTEEAGSLAGDDDDEESQDFYSDSNDEGLGDDYSSI